MLLPPAFPPSDRYPYKWQGKLLQDSCIAMKFGVAFDSLSSSEKRKALQRQVAHEPLVTVLSLFFDACGTKIVTYQNVSEFFRRQRTVVVCTF